MLERKKIMNTDRDSEASGEFVTEAGERWYAIRNVDRMAPFFISVISNVDHWLFVSSFGGLTAGRVSPDTALFPYITVDRVHESASHTGSKTLLRVGAAGQQQHWEPFNHEHDGRYAVSRNLYKNTLGNKLRFEEINHDLQLCFRCTWMTSDDFGFIRQCELENLGGDSQRVEFIDGLQNVLPAGTPRLAQAESSNLVNAYKWSELFEDTGLAIFTLYSGIWDRPEPRESLRANTVFSLGLERPKILLSSAQLDDFRANRTVEQETHKRGMRGAYLANVSLELAARELRQWQFVADLEKTQGDVVDLRKRLDTPEAVAAALKASIDQGSDELARIMAAADGFQAAAEETVTTHHYANVLFNVLRGGIFDDQYRVSTQDFAASVKHFNRLVFERNEPLLSGLPASMDSSSLMDKIRSAGDTQLERLCYEYLPITFGRRHGDPSRPWNTFTIKLKDETGNRLLSYEGNWRDIFQNWEALTFSYPEFIENVIAKFVNASTMDGYNPYRITKQGIDWEIEDPEDPWSYIGYWGDHQIIYLQKLLEWSHKFHPTRLRKLLRQPIFSYANVPYRIKDFDSLLQDPKHTVVFDHELAERIDGRVAVMGADGKLVLNADGDVYQVNLVEKLLVPLLAKLGNLVVDGGIWLNTQRPEWNDANNALVGHGLSMVTLYYMRRFVRFLRHLLGDETESLEMSPEVARWLTDTEAALNRVRQLLQDGPINANQRYQSIEELGRSAERYRRAIYGREPLSGKTMEPLGKITAMLDSALAVIDHSIGTNQRKDSLYNAYNLMKLSGAGIDVDELYPMLEGQVAVLSSGAITPDGAVQLMDALFDSDIYRAEQHSFMLYPDRKLPNFLDKNRIAAADVDSIPLLKQMLAAGDQRILTQDASGCYRFNADFANVGDLGRRIDTLALELGEEIETARAPLQALYEKVFDHRSFTGRSGGMFGFEGLGCIYWHMVSKLLLAIQENFFLALDAGADEVSIQRLGELYYRVREGLGFNKTPSEYGAFPNDPYSHTPRHAGARQPGMTGQVKEEILSRFGELGVRVRDGAVEFLPGLLRAREFVREERSFCYLDVDGCWQEQLLPASALAFTWCQVPVIYLLADDGQPSLEVTLDDDRHLTFPELGLPVEQSAEIFQRSGVVRRLTVKVTAEQLFPDG
jgi:hypothetical protein